MVRQIPKNSGKWYYQFFVDGERYNGPCKGCTTKRDAEAYEKDLKKTQYDMSRQKTKQGFIDNYYEALTGGTQIMLSDAFDLSLKKPHKRLASEKFTATKREAFNDFLAFMNEKYPDVVELKHVKKSHAEEYIALLRSSGRYVKELSYVRNGRTITRPVSGVPSSRTAILYQTVCAEVFRLLASDAGLITNPFDEIVKPAGDEETREAFSKEELRLIFENVDDFTKPLFTVAIMTALREGDICTLRWKDIDFNKRVIRRVMNKTKRLVEIPMTDEAVNYFYEQRENSEDSEFVFPKLAKMYSENRSGIPYRVKQFLEGLGIQTTRTPKGRTRAVSVKDLHSCRHTFCYYAGMRGIPLAVVQSIVGHMTPEMTKHYSDHATLKDKQRYMPKIADFIGTGTTTKILSAGELEPERQRLKHFAETLPLNKVKEILAILREA